MIVVKAKVKDKGIDLCLIKGQGHFFGQWSIIKIYIFTIDFNV